MLTFSFKHYYFSLTLPAVPVVSFDQQLIQFLSTFFPSCISLLFARNTVNNRMTMRAFGHNLCCDNQSSNVVLRGEVYLRLFPLFPLLYFIKTETAAWRLNFCISLSLTFRDSVTGGAQPCHDVETLPDQTFITSTQSTLSNGTFVYFLGKRRGHSGVQVMQGDWQLSRYLNTFHIRTHIM